MPAPNSHIVEVLFAMWFDPNSNDWDSTYFGRFHETIKPLGYTEIQEEKAVEFRIELASKPRQEIKEGKIRMTFRNPQSNTAIILSEHFISFHKLPPYENWQNLMQQVVEPGFKCYSSLGLGKNLTEVQCLYLNLYELSEQEGVSKHFNFIPEINGGKEKNVLFQARYEMEDGVSVQLKLNANPKSDRSRDLFFECATFAKSSPGATFHSLSMKAHDKANEVYQKIITS